jgi:dTDP-4-dehydrorhamnose 3,5-epimerase
MFEFTETEIKGLCIIAPKIHIDNRGKLIKKFHMSSFDSFGLPSVFSEELISTSKYGVLRGLHFQVNKPQAKLVNVVKGKIYDVAVDLRENSDTYGSHYGLELSEHNGLMLFIPEGFAHGFLSLEAGTIVSYLCSSEYEASYDSGIYYNDPDLNIAWPKISGEYILSPKDIALGSFKDFLGFMSEKNEK